MLRLLRGGKKMLFFSKHFSKHLSSTTNLYIAGRRMKRHAENRDAADEPEKKKARFDLDEKIIVSANSYRFVD